MNQNRLPALDGLRGVAALTVVVYHTLGYSEWFREGMYGFEASGPLARLLTLSPLRVFLDGRVAVVAFFVLSGFVLARSFWRGAPTRWAGYYLRRSVRLYLPVLASGVLAVVLLGFRQVLTGEGTGWVDLHAAGTSVAGFFSNLGLLGLTHAPLNVVWWSMRWEVWFSIILPVVLVVLAFIGCGPRRRFRAAPALFGIACVATIGFQPWIRLAFETSGWASRAILYLPMFGVGVALAAFERGIADGRWLRRPRWAWATAGVAFVLVGSRGPLGALRAGHHLEPVLADGLSQGATIVGVAIVVVLLVGWPRGIAALSARPVLWVGARSYSLYLVHLPLVALLAAAFQRESAPVWFLALCVGASLIVASGFYRIVEVPSTRLSRRFGSRRTPAVTAPVPEAVEAPLREPVEVG